LAFATRAIAGAASRFSDVTVAVPGTTTSTLADGAFDLHPTGGDEEHWPAMDRISLPHPVTSYAHVIVDEVPASLDLFSQQQRVARPIRLIAPPDSGAGMTAGVESLAILPNPAGVPEATGIHIPINPLAATHRHNGLGFIGYLLVLSNRPGSPSSVPPTDLVSWITASFHDTKVVVIEGGSAAVWQGRVLRGVVPVETRTDLWRLLAHARLTIDLEPGPIVARECIESLRVGTPIVVPKHSTAEAHAAFGVGLTFDSVAELISCIDRLQDDRLLTPMQQSARDYAERWYGRPEQFVANLARSLAGRATS
jgi:hypothetical protein